RTINVTTTPLLTSTVNVSVCENAFPTTILGHLFNAAGTLIDTVASTTNGCDTVRTINVTTTPLLTSTVNVSVCENAFPTTILGHLFNAAGSLIDTVASTTGGCDTLRTINVTTTPLLTSTVNVSVCENAFPTTILGHLFNAAGTLIDTVASTTNGCDTLRTINVTTTPLLTSTVNISVCENAFPTTILGHLFNAPGSLTDTVASTTNGCDTLRTINVTTTPLLTSTVNISVCENAFPTTILGHLFNAAGSLTDTVASTTNGCDTLRTINVT